MDRNCQNSTDLMMMTTVSGYAVTTNDIVTSSLNVVTSFGHVIVATTTKARVAEGSLNHVTLSKSSVLLAVKNKRYVENENQVSRIRYF